MCACSALCTGVCVVVKGTDSGTTVMTVRVPAATFNSLCLSQTHTHTDSYLKSTNQNPGIICIIRTPPVDRVPFSPIKWTSLWTSGAPLPRMHCCSPTHSPFHSGHSSTVYVVWEVTYTVSVSTVCVCVCFCIVTVSY